MLNSPGSPSPEEYKIFVSKPLFAIARLLQFDLDSILEELLLQRSDIDTTIPVYCSVPMPLRRKIGASRFIISLEQDRIFCELLSGKTWAYFESVDGFFSLSLNYEIPLAVSFTLVDRKLQDIIEGLDFLGDEKIVSLGFPNQLSDDPFVVFIEPQWIEIKTP